MNKLKDLLLKIGFVNDGINLNDFDYVFDNHLVVKFNNTYYYDSGNYDKLSDEFEFETNTACEMIIYINNKFKQELRKHKIDNLLKQNGQ